MSDYARLSVNGKDYELPLIHGHEGESAINISKLRAQTHLTTFDPGFKNTSVCRSHITYLNGEDSVLKHRGEPIEKICAEMSFCGLAYFLLLGEKPNAQVLSHLEEKIEKYSQLPKAFEEMILLHDQKAHPMNILATMFSAMSSFYPEHAKEHYSSEEVLDVLALVLGHTKSIMTRFYHHKMGKNAVSSAQGSYSESFLESFLDKKLPNTVLKAFDLLLMLHADHEQNCSTTAVRCIASSQANLFASLSAGVQALWGPLHGGANQRVMEMLQTIADAGGDCSQFITKAKDKADPFRLMGFGHRVYKNYDPRAKVIKGYCGEVLKALGKDDELLTIAQNLEAAAMADDYFNTRKLYPNVDFYSGIIYRAMGIPAEFFTGLFVMGRVPGWIAQWHEFRNDSEQVLLRPRQVYVGKTTSSS